jgi:hypothetical protein
MREAFRAPPTVYRRSVTDIVPARAPLFWNLRKG